ncbi:MAG TPA: ABC transporter substrate-binding protein [Terriglobales bacterium]|nr:ABC transporter substrate-binding protein [Terriglobales bacterium]
MQGKTIFLAFCLWLSLGSTSAFSQNYPTIYVGLVSVTPSNGAIMATVEGGYFKKHGLDVKPIIMAGSSTAIAAMLSGEVSVIAIAASGLINAYLAGRDAVMVAGIVNFAPYELIVSKDIRSIEDLKGKKMGIARFGGSADFLARWGLNHYGLKPDKDVIVLQVGGNAERMAAVSQGAIQATLLEQAFAHLAKKRGLRSLLDYSTAGLDYQHSGMGTTKSFIAKDPDLMKRFLEAMIEGIHRYKTDRAFGLKVLERHLRVQDPETIQAVYDYYAPKTPLVPHVNMKGINFLLDTIAKRNPKAKNAKPEDIVDDSILQGIEASGFVKQVAGGR